jgi:hypothetical protein
LISSCGVNEEALAEALEEELKEALRETVSFCGGVEELK